MGWSDAYFKKLVDKQLLELYQSKKINSFYQKWFMSPLPNNRVNLNMPMSDMLKELYLHPHDNYRPVIPNK